MMPAPDFLRRGYRIKVLDFAFDYALYVLAANFFAACVTVHKIGSVLYVDELEAVLSTPSLWPRAALRALARPIFYEIMFVRIGFQQIARLFNVFEKALRFGF